MSIKMIVGLFLPAVFLFFSITLMAAWHRNRDASHLRVLSIGFLLMTVGYIVSNFLIPKTSPFNPLLCHPFTYGGISTVICGMCMRASVRHPAALLIPIGVLSTAFAVLATASFDSTNIRSLFTNGSLAGVALIGCWFLWHRRRVSALDWLLCASLGVFGVMMAVAPALTLIFGQAINAGSYHASAYWYVLNLTVILSVLTVGGVILGCCVQDMMVALEQRGDRDGLTGLLVRRAFDEAVEGVEAGTVIIADIDHFKSINDTSGHAVGDRVIAAFGTIVAETARPGDIAGRIGGEEFCMVLIGADVPMARLAAERMRATIQSVAVDGMDEGRTLSASFGIAALSHDDTISDALRAADRALYAAKQSGRNRVCVAGDWNNDTAERRRVA